MLTCGVVLIHNNVCLHTVAHTRALMKYFNWELFDHPPHSPDLTLSNYHLFTCSKNWLRSQHFNNNEKLMEGVKTWLTSASVPAVTTLRSSLSMYVFFIYNKTFFFSLFVL
jgi:hypothetical protein